MIQEYKGHYTYSEPVIKDWEDSSIGVYYCGTVVENKLMPLYIGKGTGEGGMRSRLLDHLRGDNWPDITHFGFQRCDTVRETDLFEVQEIELHKPKYNTQHA
jgi:hypothetical protein